MLTTDTTITLVNTLVVSRIDYCNAVLAGVRDVHLRQLQAVLNAAARLIVRKRKYDSISATIRDVLHWLPIRQRVEFKLCTRAGVQQSSQPGAELSVHHVSTSRREPQPSVPAFSCTWRPCRSSDTHNQCSKNPGFFLKKAQPSGFLLVFFGFGVSLGFFWTSRKK